MDTCERTSNNINSMYNSMYKDAKIFSVRKNCNRGRLKRKMSSRFRGDNDIKKGPWKAEEDEVLINHVNKYGPRDWSSIRSKGLLRRTGKSCRLRWVNKLRPNLKNGCKFSLEEERIVIELQEQFGNKWARIATYLPGRTDNDVKNFWSSRKKRLGRVLQAKQTASSMPTKQSNSCDEQQHLPLTWEVGFYLCTYISKLVDLADDEMLLSLKLGNEASSAQMEQHCSYVDQSSDMLLTGLMEPCLMNFNPNFLGPEMMAMAPEGSMNVDCPAAEFPIQVPFAPMMMPVPLSPESQELVARLENGGLINDFEQEDGTGTGNVGMEMMLPPHDCGVGGEDDLAAPDSFFDDFPADMFDHIESLPSPSNFFVLVQLNPSICFCLLNANI